MMRNIYNVFGVMFILLSGINLHAQYAWRNLGPDNSGSRTRALAFDNSGNLLAGSQGGGLWISRNSGVSWDRVSSYTGNPNITSIAVDGNNIYVATGATAYELSYFVTRLNRNSTYNWQTDPEGFKGYLTGLPGGGVYISEDNGSSWSSAPATNTAQTINYKGPFSSIQKVAVINNRIYLATAEGLFYSNDKKLTANSLVKCSGSATFQTGVVYDVEGAEGSVVFATAKSGFKDSLYVSSDGINFAAVADPVLYSLGPFSASRSEIAVAPSAKNTIYVAGTQVNNEISGVFRSDDNGTTWRVYGPKGSPGFTPLGSTGQNAFAMAVSPTNPNEVIIAGNAWFSFKEGRGWTPTAQQTSPTLTNYVPRKIYTIVYNPANTSELFVGTDRQIIHSPDGGVTFSQKSKGYEATVAYSVASLSVETVGADDPVFDAVITGTETAGYLLNRHYNSDGPTNQGFGTIATNNFGEIAVSYLHPGAFLLQGTDNGIVRSFNAGENSERFYGLPIQPNVQNLDTANNVYVDRSGANVQGGALFNAPTPAQTAWVLDELIPANLLNNNQITDDELEAQSEGYIFLCSRNYVWVVNGGFGDGLQVKWNRITNQLVDGGTEYLTAIAVSGDAEHTLYVGSSRGKLWRIDRAHDLENFNVLTNVVRIDNVSGSNLTPMAGRWVSSIAVDPNDPNRIAVTYGSYGGNVQAIQGFVWVTETAKTTPSFGLLTGHATKEPVYTAEFIKDPAENKSILLIGTESKLWSVREIQRAGPGVPLYLSSPWTDESGTSFSGAPVYDIFVRKYKSKITPDALTRTEIKINPLPGGGFDTTEVEVSKSSHFLSLDNTVYIASHGFGIWSTNSVVLGRESGPTDPVVIDKLNISLYPNPTRDIATVKFELPEAADVRLMMYTADGRNLFAEQKNYDTGIHEVNFETDNLAPGMYFIRIDIQSETTSVTKTLKSVVIH
ncbi:MAG: T9SS type A sorting domain-containing protein [Bacteroidia bacterium]|nr:T9SS type A sorting domain-containing protein [Bacteroidia bacterium]